MIAALLLDGTLGQAAFVAGLVGVVAVGAAAPRRTAPSVLALCIGFACLAAAGLLGSAGGPATDVQWSVNLVAIAVMLVMTGSALAYVEHRARDRQLTAALAESEARRREVERLTGLNVRLEDELHEHRLAPRVSGDRSGAADLEAALARHRRALEAATASARRLRSIVDGATEGIVLLERETLRLAEFNPALPKLVGADARELATRTILDLFAPGPARPGRSDLQRAARENRALACELSRAGGGVVPVELSITVAGEGAEASLLVVIRDVSGLRTKERDTETALAAAAEKARDAEILAADALERAARLEAELDQVTQIQNRKDEYLSMVSHELRTPLTSIRSFSEILLKHGDAEPAIRAEFIGIIHKESERLTRMVNNVLDLARIEAGATKLSISEFDARTVVSDAAKSICGMAEAAGVRIVATAGTAPRPMRADRDRVQQLLMNLLSNAIKFSPAGSDVLLRFESDAPAGRVRFAVEDRGCGIAPEDQARVFDKFQRVEDGSEASRMGTGLGLAICREIVTLHGGRIWLESRPGVGSVFRAEFPAVEEMRARTPPRAASFGPASSGASQAPARTFMTETATQGVRVRQTSAADGRLPPLPR